MSFNQGASEKVNGNTPLYNSRIINTYLEYLAEKYPDIHVDSILEYAGMAPYEVEDSAHWFSQNQVDRFQQILYEETHDPELAREAGRFTVLSKKIGAVKQYTLGLMSPASVYMMSGKLYNTMSRGASVTTRRLSANKVKVVATPMPDVKEKLFQCKNRIGTLESLAKLFTGEFARVAHPECYHRGDRHCCYIVSWALTESIIWERRRNAAWALSALVVLLLHLVTPIHVWLIASLTAVVAALTLSLFSLHLKQKELSETAASHGNTAVDLLDAINVRYNNALLMQEIGHAAASILDQDQYIDIVMQVMEKRLDFDRGLVMLEKDDHKGVLQYAASYGHTSEQRRMLQQEFFNLEHPNSTGIFVKVFKGQESFLVEDVRKITASISDHSKNFAEKIASKSFICVPIIYKKQTLGLIAVDNLFSKKALTKSDLNILKAIASQVALGIANAGAFKRLQEKEETVRTLYESTKKAEQLYSSLLISSPDAIVVYDLNGNLQFLNPAFTRTFGWTRDEAEAMIVGTDPGNGNANIFGTIKDMIDRNETCINVESRQYTQSGKLLDVTISASHFEDHQGKPAGVLFIFRNISAKKRLEEQLLQAQKMEALGTLVAGVAHEINNPINGIINYAQLMVDQEEERNNDVELPHRIIAEGERIATIVKNLLSVARSSEGARSRDSIRDLLLESLALIEPQFRKEGILLTLDLPDSLPDVMVNGQEIQQVFLNVLSNAQYALHQKSTGGAGGKKLDITVEKTNTNGIDYIRTTFYDNGTGIQNDVLPKICNPFFSTKPAGQGTGLGLSISHNIIKDHEGKLLFESVENEFTKVMIDLKAHGDAK
jgi:PAS domain S-box-containing protein